MSTKPFTSHQYHTACHSGVAAGPPWRHCACFERPAEGFGGQRVGPDLRMQQQALKANGCP
ncbi:hypothetical protein N7454_008538 [Penicillium verhagenii]|nr:hypothetical protein N7454_008538 [Penicillium verhagenii]